MSTQYTYSISEDTENGSVYLSTLELELTTSGITGYEHLTTVGDTLEIWFANALSPSDETLLTSVVATHDGIPVPWEKTHVCHAYEQGRLVKETWYAKICGDELNGKVEETDYTWSGARLLSETITRFNRAGDVDSVEYYEYSSDGCQVRKEKIQ